MIGSIKTTSEVLKEVMEDIHVQRPPIGVMPKKVWLAKRRKELKEAIIRYMDAEKKIPKRWIKELNKYGKKIH